MIPNCDHQGIYLLEGRTHVSALRLSAHAGAPLQDRELSYFYERNLV